MCIRDRYGDYMDKPTKANASAFITLALEANWDSIHESEQYMKSVSYTHLLCRAH